MKENPNERDEPLVKDKTSSSSESVQSVLLKKKNGRIYIPPYQRDSGQWDERKEALFIESVLNNLTIPAFFFAEDDNGNFEVVDGQQRLTTIERFYQGNLTLSRDEDIDYLVPQGVSYIGKNYNQLPSRLKRVFEDYPLTIIYLPRNIELPVKLEIFRRINEGGTPLTGQDIRLAYYSQSKCVTFMRLAGIYTESDAVGSMLQEAAKLGLANPWIAVEPARRTWMDWWEGRERAKGQTPSLMFLWFLVCLDRARLDDLLRMLQTSGANHLGLSFRGSIEEALDIYCAQLKFQEEPRPAGTHQHLASLGQIAERFDQFARWFDTILSRGLPGISVDKYKQLALLMAGASEVGVDIDGLSETQWNLIGSFVRRPLETAKTLLDQGQLYPTPKGKWFGQKGQKQQLDMAVEIIKRIRKR